MSQCSNPTENMCCWVCRLLKARSAASWTKVAMAHLGAWRILALTLKP